MHHKYIDIEEFVEDEEKELDGLDETHWDTEEGYEDDDDEDDVEGEDWFMMPTDWYKLLNLPEIRHTEQLDQLILNPIHRQATHIFIYFYGDDCFECYDQLDEVNDAYIKAVNTYGIDSV